jgi:ATP-dependent DNA helicase RecQ
LFTQLRQKRKALADEANVPPYVIFNDRSLAEMATYYPQSIASFGQIHGVGQSKLEKYADIFLPLIQAYCQANNLAEKAHGGTALTPAKSQTAVGMRTAVIGDMYANGKPIPDIAADLGVKNSTVLSHLLKVVQGGRPLPAAGFRQLSTLSAAEQNQVLAAFAEQGPDFLRPIYDTFEQSISYDELHILRLVYLCQE